MSHNKLTAEEVLKHIGTYDLTLSHTSYDSYPPWVVEFAGGIYHKDGYSAEEVVGEFLKWVNKNEQKAIEWRERRDDAEYVRLSKKFGTFA